MRIVHTDAITKAMKEMCIEANLYLTEDVMNRLKKANLK
jgi:fumarate hydratase subunit alpha